MTGRVPEEGELARLMEALDGARGERKEPNSDITAIRFAKCAGDAKRQEKKGGGIDVSVEGKVGAKRQGVHMHDM